MDTTVYRKCKRSIDSRSWFREAIATNRNYNIAVSPANIRMRNNKQKCAQQNAAKQCTHSGKEVEAKSKTTPLPPPPPPLSHLAALPAKSLLCQATKMQLTATEERWRSSPPPPLCFCFCCCLWLCLCPLLRFSLVTSARLLVWRCRLCCHLGITKKKLK